MRDDDATSHSDPRVGPPDPALQARIEALLRSSLGARIAAIEPIAPGLGERRFYRLELEGGTADRAVARVEAPEDTSLRPAGVDPEPALEPLRSFLEAHDIPVPQSYGIDAVHGIQLLEDLGSESLEDLAARVSSEERRALYAEACTIAARLQTLNAEPSEVPAFGRRLGSPLFRYKAEQVIEWALPWSLGRAASPAESEVVRVAFASIARECEAAPQRLSHRDYKAANLHPRPQAGGTGPLALIDLQGALLAPPEYDFVCLLRDAHVALPDQEVAAQIESVRPNLPDAPAADAFARRFHLLTLSRVGKDLSRYLYAARVRGDRRYLRLLPEATRTLRAAAKIAAAWSPELERLAALLAPLPEDWSSAESPRKSDEPCVQ